MKIWTVAVCKNGDHAGVTELMIDGLPDGSQIIIHTVHRGRYAAVQHFWSAGGEDVRQRLGLAKTYEEAQKIAEDYVSNRYGLWLIASQAAKPPLLGVEKP